MSELDPAPKIEDLFVEIDAASRVNFAMQQNGVPLVQRLRLVNRGAEDLSDLEVRVRSDPEFFAAWSRGIDRLGAGREIVLESVDLGLSPGFLVNLTEAIRGRMIVEVRAGGELLAEESRDIELLSYDQWPGLSVLPEILAAFVLPNHPSVERVLSVAADLLETATGSPALDGYQTEDPRRVWAIASAIYKAIQVTGIEYVSPPASFESDGQKIRTPDRILGTKRGTCLDLTLLLAACMEQVGLHPWIVLVQGHAFPGAWLREGAWPTPVVDDAAALRKRRDLGELFFFDSSSVAQRPPVAFESAVRVAFACLEDDAKFSLAIDLRQARQVSGIRPMAGRVAEGTFQPLIEPAADSAASGGAWAPGEIPAGMVQPSEAATLDGGRKALEGPAARLDRWKRKLLDLSLRNRLLNFRESKKTIQLLVPDLASFEDQIASGSAFNVDANPAKDNASAESIVEALRTREPQVCETLRAQMSQQCLHTPLTDRELERRLTQIYRESRRQIEETGANMLYVALGMLRWYPTKTTSEPRHAPILLVPLEIRRQSARDRFRIAIGTDEPRVNHTLLEMLRADFGIELGAIEELPSDESGVDVPLVLRTVRHVIRDVPRWDVIEDAWIGLFSFSKFLMWRDLAERTEDLLGNSVIAHILNASGEAFESDGDFVGRDDVEQRSPATIYCPLDSDASQLAAVLSAEEGRSFALQGPPGTGKSQTITNLIAQCLATGKKVLFVAEKMAALDVVHSRLGRVGLGDFCLELHSCCRCRESA